MLAASYRVGRDLSRSSCEADETIAIVNEISEVTKPDGVEHVATVGENSTSNILEEASKGSFAALCPQLEIGLSCWNLTRKPMFA